MRRFALFLVALLAILAIGPMPSAHAQAYVVTNLVSDGSVPAVTTDPNFLNPWGISVSGTWWISTANSGLNYVVNSTTDAIGFDVIIPNASGLSNTGSPAGTVTTSGASGMVLSNSTKASFLFSTLDGAIYGWNSKLGTTTGAVAIPAINNTTAGASYPGLALLNVNSTTSYLLVPNFGLGNKVEVYDQNFNPATLAGSFTDPNLPAGYAPWSIHILNNQVWVAYAQRTVAIPYTAVTGPGNGVVDVFDTSGNFVARAVTGGNLNAPWGVAFAPATGFGVFSGDLLIGNFGDGIINVYDPKSYAFLGQLVDSNGKPLAYGSLWDLLTGGTPVSNGTNPSAGGSKTSVYFTAGLTNEDHGLLGAISSATVAGASPTFGFSSSAGAVTVVGGTTANMNLAVVPVNGFSGTVTFACSGLPANANCSFSPSSVNVTSSAVASTALTISTGGSTSMGFLHFHRSMPTIALASLVPLSLLPFALSLRRRRRSTKALRLLGPLLILILGYAATALVLGCSSSSSPSVTPHGNSMVTVTATSGSTSQQTTVSLTVM